MGFLILVFINFCLNCWSVYVKIFCIILFLLEVLFSWILYVEFIIELLFVYVKGVLVNLNVKLGDIIFLEII